jgi:hypothetical protein
VAADRKLFGAMRALLAALREIEAPSMLIGGIAVILSGVARETVDVDATILGKASDIDAILVTLARHGIVPRIYNAAAFARERQVLLLVHEPTRVTMEITFGWLPFEEEALARASEIEFEGDRLRIARPEDLIVYKAAAWRDRDRSDIERLLTLHGDTIDLERVRRLVAEIAEALDDPGRVAAFEEIVKRARAV